MNNIGLMDDLKAKLIASQTENINLQVRIKQLELQVNQTVEENKQARERLILAHNQEISILQTQLAESRKNQHQPYEQILGLTIGQTAKTSRLADGTLKPYSTWYAYAPNNKKIYLGVEKDIEAFTAKIRKWLLDHNLPIPTLDQTVENMKRSADEARDQVNTMQARLEKERSAWLQERESLKSQIAKLSTAKPVADSTITFIYGLPIRKTYQKVKRGDLVETKEIYIAYVTGNKNIYLGLVKEGEAIDNLIPKFKETIKAWHERQGRSLPNFPQSLPHTDLIPDDDPITRNKLSTSQSNVYLASQAQLRQQPVLFDALYHNADGQYIGNYVYFLEDGDYIKIGTTTNLETRLQTLQTINPKQLKLLGVLHGDYELELYLHDLFREFRINNEWFRKNSKIIEYIRFHCQQK